METFKIPLREIRRRFTKSEVVLMAWRSQEQHHAFKQRMKQDSKDVTSSGKKRKHYSDAIGPERMPDKFFDEQGDFNLSKVTGEEARMYFERQLRIPMPPGVSKIRSEDSTSQQIRQAYGIRR